MSIFAKRLHDFVPMHPNTVHHTESEHDHQRKRTAITDKRQWHTSDRQERDRHTDILENVRENRAGYSNHQKKTELVAGKEGDEKTGQEQQGECADEKHSADKSPLLANCRKNVVVVHCGRRQKAELDLRIRCFKAFTCPTTGADRDKRLIDCPRRTLFVDVRMRECSQAGLLIRLEHEVRRDRNHRKQEQKDTDEITKRDSANQKQSEQHGNPDENFTQVRLKQDE